MIIITTTTIIEAFVLPYLIMFLSVWSQVRTHKPEQRKNKMRGHLPDFGYVTTKTSSGLVCQSFNDSTMSGTRIAGKATPLYWWLLDSMSTVTNWLVVLVVVRDASAEFMFL